MRWQERAWMAARGSAPSNRNHPWHPIRIVLVIAVVKVLVIAIVIILVIVVVKVLVIAIVQVLVIAVVKVVYSAWPFD